MSDWQNFRWVLDILLVVVGTVMWFLMRKLITDVENLGRALDAYKLHVAENYVTQPTMTESFRSISTQIAEVFRKLERIDDKLDKKADR